MCDQRTFGSSKLRQYIILFELCQTAFEFRCPHPSARAVQHGYNNVKGVKKAQSIGLLEASANVATGVRGGRAATEKFRGSLPGSIRHS